MLVFLFIFLFIYFFHKQVSNCKCDEICSVCYTFALPSLFFLFFVTAVLYSFFYYFSVSFLSLMQVPITFFKNQLVADCQNVVGKRRGFMGFEMEKRKVRWIKRQM